MPACAGWSWLPHRYVICSLCFLGVLLSVMLRFCISIAITEMVRPGNQNVSVVQTGSCPADRDEGELSAEAKGEGQFDWDEPTQGLILSSFFWGYGAGQMPAGLVVEVLGGKYSMLVAVLLSALCTLVTPPCVDWGGAWGIIVNRTLLGCSQGLLYPSINTVLAHWVATEERGRVASIIYAGANFGHVISMTLSGYLLKWTRWSVMFYGYGAAALLWVCLWMSCGYSKPEDHPGLIESERRYLEKYWGEVNLKNKPQPTPWRHMSKSVPLWGLVVAQMGFDWGFFTIIADLPKYLRNVLHITFQTGVYTALINVAMGVAAVLAGAVVDFLLVKGITSVITSRILFTTISLVGPAVGMVAASYAGCDQDLATFSLFIGMGLMGCFYSSVTVNCIDISPNYAGTVMALVNGLGAIAGFIAPYLTGLIIPDNTIEQWRAVFYMAAGVMVVTCVIYNFTATGEVQYWNNLPAEPTEPTGDGLELECKNGKGVTPSVNGQTFSMDFGTWKTAKEDI